MSLLILELYDLEAILAVFELMFMGALLNIMLEKFGDFYVLGTEWTTVDVLAFFSQMKVIEILVLEFVTVNTTELTISITLFITFVRLLFYFAYLCIHVLLHSHKYHRIELLEIFHDGLFTKKASKVRSYIVSSIFLSQSYLFLQ